jgi:hypothetical protein
MHGGTTIKIIYIVVSREESNVGVCSLKMVQWERNM